MEVIDRRVKRHADPEEYRKIAVAGQYAPELSEDNDSIIQQEGNPNDSLIPEGSAPADNHKIHHRQARLPERLTYCLQVR